MKNKEVVLVLRLSMGKMGKLPWCFKVPYHSEATALRSMEALRIAPWYEPKPGVLTVYPCSNPRHKNRWHVGHRQEELDATT